MNPDTIHYYAAIANVVGVWLLDLLKGAVITGFTAACPAALKYLQAHATLKEAKAELAKTETLNTQAAVVVGAVQQSNESNLTKKALAVEKLDEISQPGTSATAVNVAIENQVNLRKQPEEDATVVPVILASPPSN